MLMSRRGHSCPPMLPSSGVSSAAQLAAPASAVLAVFVWGASDFSGGFASRRGNAFVVTAFSHVCAFALMFVIALAQHGAFPSRIDIYWALAAGSIGGFALAIFYRALAAGQMGLTAPIAALLGAAIPTLADLGMEGAPSRWMISGFALAIVAIWLITRPETTEASDSLAHPKGVAMAALAGVGFAGFYVCIHQAHGSPTWLATISRVGSFMTTSIAVLVMRPRLALPRTSLLFAMIAGCLDITGTVLFIFASQHGRLDEAVVITSLYPAVTVLLARIVLKEHFSRWKFVGLLAALAAVPLISAG
jgi:drug/metabolite transporter (DMT)-like permease